MLLLCYTNWNFKRFCLPWQVLLSCSHVFHRVSSCACAHVCDASPVASGDGAILLTESPHRPACFIRNHLSPLEMWLWATVQFILFRKWWILWDRTPARRLPGSPSVGSRSWAHCGHRPQSPLLRGTCFQRFWCMCMCILVKDHLEQATWGRCSHLLKLHDLNWTESHNYENRTQ